MVLRFEDVVYFAAVAGRPGPALGRIETVGAGAWRGTERDARVAEREQPLDRQRFNVLKDSALEGIETRPPSMVFLQA